MFGVMISNDPGTLVLNSRDLLALLWKPSILVPLYKLILCIEHYKDLHYVPLCFNFFYLIKCVTIAFMTFALR